MYRHHLYTYMYKHIDSLRLCFWNSIHVCLAIFLLWCRRCRRSFFIVYLYTLISFLFFISLLICRRFLLCIIFFFNMHTVHSQQTHDDSYTHINTMTIDFQFGFQIDYKWKPILFFFCTCLLPGMIFDQISQCNSRCAITIFRPNKTLTINVAQPIHLYAYKFILCCISFLHLTLFIVLLLSCCIQSH